jgi:hypothetical protein
MSFGRNKNLVRRPIRPDGGFHRSKRRKTVVSRLTMENDSIFRSLLHLLKMPFRRR